MSQSRQGRDVIGYLKALDDVSTLEEVRSGRKRLATVWMRRYPTTIDRASIRRTVDPNGRRSQTGPDGEDGVKIVTAQASARANLKAAALMGLLD